MLVGGQRATEQHRDLMLYRAKSTALFAAMPIDILIQQSQSTAEGVTEYSFWNLQRDQRSKVSERGQCCLFSTQYTIRRYSLNREQVTSEFNFTVGL